MTWTVSREFRADLRPPAWMATASSIGREVAMLESIQMADGTALAIAKATDEQIVDFAERGVLFQESRRK